MYEENSSTSKSAEVSDSKRLKKHTKAFIVVIENFMGEITDTPFATFDRALAEEMCLEYAWELMYEQWYLSVHGKTGAPAVSAVYTHNLTDFNAFVREINWYGYE